ncbi:MAG: hypothetical protein U9Q24_03505, partial [Candidatus Ratteibacteria bacterium]|nr:hypothetical protein [Candidatus Ratteibacteria bacterium]
TVRRLPLSIIFVIFSVFGGAFAYNATVIISLTFSGLAMFLLARIYLKSDFPAFIAGLIYAASPFALAQLLGGHTNGFLWGIVPLAVFSLEKLFSEGELKFALLYFFCLFSFALIEYHFLYYLSFFSLLFLPIKTVTSLARWKEDNFNLIKRLMKAWAPIFLSLLLVFLFVVFLKNVELGVSIARKGRDLSEVRLYSPGIKDLFSRGNVDAEKNIYLGMVSLALAFLGFIFSSCRSASSTNQYEEKINRLFFAGGLLISAILALGPSLNDFFPLYNFCYKFIPYFNYPRVPGRIIAISFLCLSVLAGNGVKEIIAFISRIRKEVFKKAVLVIVGISLCFGIFLDCHSNSNAGICLFDKKNRIYEIIRENAGDKKVLELPLWPGDTAWTSIYLYYVTLTQVKIINGYYPLVPQEYVDRIFYPLISLNLGDISQAQYEFLKKLGVKYIVMHEDAFPLKVSHFRSIYSVNRLKQSAYLKFVTREKLIWLFELRDKPVLKEDDSKLISVAGVLKLSGQFHRRIGRLIDDPAAEDGQALFASVETDQPGHLLFGRQQVFPRGEYKLIFRLKTDDNTISEPIAILDVCANNGHDIISRQEIKGTDFKKAGKYQDFVIKFNPSGISIRDEAGQVPEEPFFPEFRIEFLNKANLWVNYLYILFADQEDPRYHYEAEDLYYRGLLSEDSDASAEETIVFTPGLTRHQEVLFGPYRRLSKGIYQISFRLKTDELSDFPLATLEVTTNFGRNKLAEREIKGSDFKEKGIYQYFSFPFGLKKEQILEFRIVYPVRSKSPQATAPLLAGTSNGVYSHQGKLWVDMIEIKPVNEL